jgi:hypothetical protein
MIAGFELDESHVALALITDALFCSELETGAALTNLQLAAAIHEALRTYRGWNGRTHVVAAAFASAPCYAMHREEWCRQLARRALGTSDPQAQFSQME